MPSPIVYGHLRDHVTNLPEAKFAASRIHLEIHTTARVLTLHLPD